MLNFIEAQEFLAALRSNWKAPAAITVLCVAIGVALAFLPRPIYRADVLISPVSNDSLRGNLASLAGSLGSVGSLLGLGIGGENDVEAAVALLNSGSLLGQFIESKHLLPVLFADKWDSQAKVWVPSVRENPPSVELAIDYFQKEVLDVSRDKITGLVTVSIYWTDREVAADWANELVALADSILRQRTAQDADAKLVYLRTRLDAESTAEVRAAISRALESQLQAKALAEAQQYFAYNVVDSARPPDAKQFVRPRRALLILAWLAIGVFISSLVTLRATTIRLAEKNSRSTNPRVA